MAKPLGCSFVVLGILTLLFGAKRYFAVQEQLIRGRFETSRSEGELQRRRESLKGVLVLEMQQLTIISLDSFHPHRLGGCFAHRCTQCHHCCSSIVADT